MYTNIVTETDLGVGIITLNRPTQHTTFDDTLIAELANAILSGTAPGALSPRAASRGEYLFSKSELARWHLTAPDAWQDKVSYVE